MDAALGTGGAGPNVVDVALRCEDLSSASRSGLFRECAPVSRPMPESDSDEIEAGNLLHGNTKFRGQLRQKGRREVHILLTLV